MMPNAFPSSAISAALVVFLVFQIQQPTRPMVLRLHAGALRELGQLTRQWMNGSVRAQFPLHSHSKHLAHRLGQGRLQLHNLSVLTFSPPQVHYQPSKNSLLYMSTDGGASELNAQWSLQSDFLLSMIRSPAFAGVVRAKIIGFSADVSIKVAQKSQLFVHQCISRFDDFQLHLGGSLAADLIHWFHRPLAQAMQSHVEEVYCQLIAEKLLPWLREQLTMLALKLHIDFGAELQLTQWLHSIKTGEGFLDLGLAQRLNHLEGGRRHRLLADMLPWELPPASKPAEHGERSMDLFLPERTLETLFSGAHVSKQLSANFTSPFLRTSCPLLCLGKFVPQMRSALGPAHLLAVLRTNQSPTVRLFQHRIRLALNISFELFEHWRAADGSAQEQDGDKDNFNLVEKGEDNASIHRLYEESKEEEVEAETSTPSEFTFEAEEEGTMKQHEEIEGNELRWEGENAPEKLNDLSEEGTVIRPKFMGINAPERRTTHHQREEDELSVRTIVFTQSTTPKTTTNGRHQNLLPFPASSAENGHRNGGKSASSSTTTHRPHIRHKNNHHLHQPVLRIVLDSELEILLLLDRPRRRLRTELTLNKVRAVLAQSQIRDLSQKTIDLLVEASIPFLENSVKILYRDGLKLDNLLPLPTRNESVHVQDGFIQYSADFSLAQFLK